VRKKQQKKLCLLVNNSVCMRNESKNQHYKKSNMENQFYTKKITKIFFVLISCFMMQNCILSNKIIEENDIVYSSKRIKWDCTYKDYNRRSPLLYLKQSIVKTISSKNEVSYNVYDVLFLTSSSFKLEDKIFIIIDNNVYTMIIKNKECENTKEITENRNEILTADSTKVSVVTGYSENNRKITRFSYKLSNDIVDKIKKSNQVLFRYYSGPNMLTVKLHKNKLNKLKQFIDKE